RLPLQVRATHGSQKSAAIAPHRMAGRGTGACLEQAPLCKRKARAAVQKSSFSEPLMSRCLRLLRVFVLCGAVGAIGAPAGAQQPATPPPAVKPQPPAQPAQQPAKPPAQATTPVKDPVVAVVNGQQIRLSELEVAQQALPPQYRNMPIQAVFPALLDRIIDSKLVVADGRKNKIT